MLTPIKCEDLNFNSTVSFLYIFDVTKTLFIGHSSNVNTVICVN